MIWICKKDLKISCFEISHNPFAIRKVNNQQNGAYDLDFLDLFIHSKTLHIERKHNSNKLFTRLSTRILIRSLIV